MITYIFGFLLAKVSTSETADRYIMFVRIVKEVYPFGPNFHLNLHVQV